jgi:hypothetical protein
MSTLRMIDAMSETTSSSSDPATGPVAATPPSPPTYEGAPRPVYEEPRRRSRLPFVAAWVGIVAGVVFIVAVVFFSGFILGKNADGHRGGGGHHGDRDVAIFHRGGPPMPMFPMGPRGEFERQPSSGPDLEPPQSPQSPSAPTTSAPARP